MLSCPFGPDWNKLVDAVGKFQAYKDYIQFEGDIRTPEQVLSKLVKEGFNMSTLPAYQYQVERTNEKIPKISEPVLTTMGEFFKLKFPGYEYRIINDPNARYKGYVEPADANVGRLKPMIVLNSAKATLDTPIHEFGHVFIHMLRRENMRAYMSIMNSIFDAKIEKTEVTDTKTGKKKTERSIVGYEPKAEYKEEFDLLKSLYPNLSEEELAEEFLVEMLGRYASEYFDPQTGKPIAEIRTSTIGEKLAKALAKLWETIREMLLGSPVTINVKDISPITSIDALASILADPNINIQFGSKLNKISNYETENLREKIKEGEELLTKINEGTNYEIVYHSGYHYILNAGTKARLEAIKNKWNKILQYVDKPLSKSNTPTFRNGLIMLNRILSSPEMRTKSLEERKAVLDRPEMKNVKFFLSIQSNIDQAINILSEPVSRTVESYMDSYAKDAYRLMTGENYASFTSISSSRSFRDLLSDLISTYSSSTDKLNKLFKIDPAVYKHDSRGSTNVSMQSIKNDVEKR